MVSQIDQSALQMTAVDIRQNLELSRNVNPRLCTVPKLNDGLRGDGLLSVAVSHEELGLRRLLHQHFTPLVGSLLDGRRWKGVVHFVRGVHRKLLTLQLTVLSGLHDAVVLLNGVEIRIRLRTFFGTVAAAAASVRIVPGAFLRQRTHAAAALDEDLWRLDVTLLGGNGASSKDVVLVGGLTEFLQRLLDVLRAQNGRRVGAPVHQGHPLTGAGVQCLRAGGVSRLVASSALHDGRRRQGNVVLLLHDDRGENETPRTARTQKPGVRLHRDGVRPQRDVEENAAGFGQLALSHLHFGVDAAPLPAHAAAHDAAERRRPQHQRHQPQQHDPALEIGLRALELVDHHRPDDEPEQGEVETAADGEPQYRVQPPSLRLLEVLAHN